MSRDAAMPRARSALAATAASAIDSRATKRRANIKLVLALCGGKRDAPWRSSAGCATIWRAEATLSFQARAPRPATPPRGSREDSRWLPQRAAANERIAQPARIRTAPGTVLRHDAVAILSLLS